ncbi:DNA-directed RNA polymerase subunit beta [Alkalicoccus luteus]|uniref:DNA-directed RNA polymerase subunit beta n=1 Tax=Alkalicoccus luteus TaxID=1237094 RepID=A0A969TT91_9BACI|nr:DNA-directed RNA polymerase subunit beta [Alkalicoccus luteus]NJP37403.1 DNA-directed RNA polymerase subunit beta [Alkalicoccus luteus]
MNDETKYRTSSGKEEEQHDKPAEPAAKEKKQRSGWFWRPIRWVPIWLRIVLALVLIAVSGVVGAMIGYTIIGEGTDPMEIFEPETWQHIYDIIYGDTEGDGGS